MGRAGLEHRTFFSIDIDVLPHDGNKSGNTPTFPSSLSSPNGLTHPELALVVATWSKLPPAVRAGILTLLEAMQHAR